MTGRDRRGQEPRAAAADMMAIVFAAVCVLAGGAAASGAGPAQAQFAPSTTSSAPEDAEGFGGAVTDLPEASPGDSLADERRESGELDGIGADGAQVPGEAAEDYDTGPTGATEATGVTTEETVVAPAADEVQAGVARNAASTPTGGMDLLGGPGWIVGGMFALGVAALLVLAALRRPAGRDTAAPVTGAIFEKPRSRFGRGRSTRTRTRASKNRRVR